MIAICHCSTNSMSNSVAVSKKSDDTYPYDAQGRVQFLLEFGLLIDASILVILSSCVTIFFVKLRSLDRVLFGLLLSCSVTYTAG